MEREKPRHKHKHWRALQWVLSLPHPLPPPTSHPFSQALHKQTQRGTSSNHTSQAKQMRHRKISMMGYYGHSTVYERQTVLNQPYFQIEYSILCRNYKCSKRGGHVNM